MRSNNRIAWLITAACVLVAVGVTVMVVQLMPSESGTGGTSPPLDASATEAPNRPNPDLALDSLQFTRYTGAYVEDGSDEEVSGVAAMLVSNPTSQFLDLGTITYKVGEKTATFVIKGLPPGGKAWVLEADRMTLEEGDTFEIDDYDFAFREDAIRQTDLLDVKTDGNTLTVTNVSEETLENVCLYYKVKHTDGNYLGGILYTLNFGTLASGAEASKQAGHFGENAEIVRYSYQTG